MKVTVDEIMGFLDTMYAEEYEADNIKKGVREDIKNYAEENEISSKAINSAYALFKKYKGGKLTADECDEITTLSNAVDAYFSGV